MVVLADVDGLWPCLIVSFVDLLFALGVDVLFNSVGMNASFVRCGLV